MMTTEMKSGKSSIELIRLFKKFPVLLFLGLMFTFSCNDDDKEEVEIQYGSMSDIDGNLYGTVLINGKWWMAENLKYANPEFVQRCYLDSLSMCEKFGVLYSRKAAMQACPSGWHLPTNPEFDSLLQTIGHQNDQLVQSLASSGNSGFDAQFGGWAHYYYSARLYEFRQVGDVAVLWTSSLDAKNYVYRLVISAKQRKVLFTRAGIKFPHGEKRPFDLAYVRCVKNK